MSIFEFIMLACFGAAWPVALYKAYVSKRNDGVSLLFLYVVLLGYISGILHKLIFNFDFIILLYVLNFIMILANIVLYYRNFAYGKMKQREREANLV